MKDMLGKIDVEAEVLHVGEYKTAFEDLAREDGSAVILVTHDNRILDVADRILDGSLRPS